MTKVNDMNLIEKFEYLLTVLQKHNILTAAEHLCCSTCAMADLEPKAEQDENIGIVYNHEQDLDYYYSRMGINRLAIRYAGMSQDSKFIGDLIHIEAINIGLDVKWNGSADKVIFIK